VIINRGALLTGAVLTLRSTDARSTDGLPSHTDQPTRDTTKVLSRRVGRSELNRRRRQTVAEKQEAQLSPSDGAMRRVS